MTNKLKVGDKVTVKMSSGVFVPDGEIVAIRECGDDLDKLLYKVYWADTETHFLVDWQQIYPPF